MKEHDGLFREEALRRFRERGTQGQGLRLAPGWTWLAVTGRLRAVGAVALWSARAEVETRPRFPAEVVSNDDRGLRTISLRAHATPAQDDSIGQVRGPVLLTFYPASGGGGIPIGAVAR